MGVLVNEIRRTDKFDLAPQNEATVVARQNVCSYRTRVIVPAQTAAGTPTSTANTAWKAIKDITLEVYAGSVKQNWAVFVWSGCALTGMESFSGDYRTRTGWVVHAALGAAGRVRRGKGI